MAVYKIAFAFLFMLCIQSADIKISRAAGPPKVKTTATCPDPGSYRDSAARLPGKKIAIGAAVRPLRRGKPMPAVTYRLNNVDYHLSDFLKKTKVAGFIVLHRGRVVKEVYCQGYSAATRLNFQSVTKSVISTLIAIMLKEHPEYTLTTKAGAIADDLSGSAYEKVPLSSILQMSSGARFRDDSDMWFFFWRLLGGASLETKVKGQKSVRPHGRKFQYSGIDTSALGMILAAATRKTNAEYLEEKIWKPLGMGTPAEWKTDKTKARRELPFCCLYATVRDIARFGLLVANDGVWNGKRLLPKGWVYKATHSDSRHVMPEGTGYPIGYQYQWWTETKPPDTFYGMGIHGQNLYIDPKAHLVVVIASQWPRNEVSEYYSHTYKLMRVLSKHYRSR